MIDYTTKPQFYFNNQRHEMLAFIPPTATRILEIGCSNGTFGASVKKIRAVQYVGVDILEQSIAAASLNLDQAILADIQTEELPFTENTFDCLVMNDVIEHLTDPWKTLSSLLQFLEPGGHIVASIPNMRYFKVLKELVLHRQWRYTDYGVLDRTHLRFFTDKSIAELFQDCGLEITKLEGINPTMLPWKISLLNRILFNALDDTCFMQFACCARKPAIV